MSRPFFRYAAHRSPTGESISRTTAFACIIIVAMTFCSGPETYAPIGSDKAAVRVCLSDRTDELVLGLAEGAVLRTVDHRYSLTGHEELRCSLQVDGTVLISVDGTPARVMHGTFQCFYPRGIGAFTFGERSYGDTLHISTDGEQLFLINTLPLETYLRGVIPNEIGRNRGIDDLEAVKAQAVLSRTYAIRKLVLPLSRLFDVHADTRDQVFSGIGEQDEIANRAVHESRGIVLSFRGREAECYYHSTCGGHTEASSLVWRRSQSTPWLAGADDVLHTHDACRISPSYRWTETYTRTQLESLLRDFLPSLSDTLDNMNIPEHERHLLDMNILKRSPSGRVSTLRIVMGTATRHHSFHVYGDNIRRVLRRPDSTPLRSTLFDIDIARDALKWITAVQINGGGSGHGVGMCQWGALARSRAGQSMQEILTKYFPGTSLRTLY